MEIPLLQGLHTDSRALEPSTEATIWKVPKLYMKKIHLLILKHLLKGKNWSGLSTGMKILADIIFAFFLYLASDVLHWWVMYLHSL